MKLIYRPMIILAYLISTICVIIWTSQGYLLTWLYKRVGWPDGAVSLNCWTFAFAKWLEEGPKETYLIVRMSRHAPVAHAFFAHSIEGLDVEELKPLEARRGWKALLHVFWHKSRIRKGEGEEKK